MIPGPGGGHFGSLQEKQKKKLNPTSPPDLTPQIFQSMFELMNAFGPRQEIRNRKSQKKLPRCRRTWIWMHVGPHQSVWPYPWLALAGSPWPWPCFACLASSCSPCLHLSTSAGRREALLLLGAGEASAADARHGDPSKPRPGECADPHNDATRRRTTTKYEEQRRTMPNNARPRRTTTDNDE